MHLIGIEGMLNIDREKLIIFHFQTKK